VNANQPICATCKSPIKRGDSVIWVEPPLDDPRRRVGTVRSEMRHAWCLPEGWVLVRGAEYYQVG
jgi:hypothetical protein